MPRSYILESETGRQFRRNRRHMFPIPNQRQFEPVHERDHSGYPPRTENDSTTSGRAINVTTENIQVGPSPPVSPVKLPALQTESAGYETRSGRISKKPVKMNLEIVRETRL